jgi:hypothetical protein
MSFRFLYTFLFISILFSVISAFGQDIEYQMNFMYVGGDTLDYSDGGTQKIKVLINKINYDSTKKNYIFTGKMCDAKDYSSIDSSYGLICLGEIDKIYAETWVGFKETGLLKRVKQYKLKEKGEFSISVPEDTKCKLIFTGIGCEVIVYSIADILKLSNN